MEAIEWHCGQGNYPKASVESIYRVFLEGSSSTLLITAVLKVTAGLWLISCCGFFPCVNENLYIAVEVSLKMPVLLIRGEAGEGSGAQGL